MKQDAVVFVFACVFLFCLGRRDARLFVGIVFCFSMFSSKESAMLLFDSV